MRRSPALGDFSSRARAIADSACAVPPGLPSSVELEAAVAAAAAALDAEPPELRSRDSSGRAGGLLELPSLPTVLVPDLHGRAPFIASLFAWTPPGSGASLETLLSEGRANLVCLGDAFHSEWGTARDRWLRAYREYSSGWTVRREMNEEMARSLGAARIVLEAKAAFPDHFHYLKGNHDNIADEEGRGDHPFYKFAAEGAMVASWFRITYGEELLQRYRRLELDLPVIALGEAFVASHGEPAFALDRLSVVEYRSRPDVVEALIWTPNGAAQAGSVQQSMEALLGADRAPFALWFAGHRPVDGRYALRAGGRFVQFHDPSARRVVYLLPGRDPDPDRDILDISHPRGN
jgi:hypothetical protein